MPGTVSLVHEGDVESVVASVFTTMMGLEVRSMGAHRPGWPGLVTAAVYLTGEWEGAISIHCAPRQACEFAGRFLGLPAPGALDDDARDVMGELANMIAGNLKCALCAGIRVSVPSVTEGADYSLRVCGARMVCELAFDSEAGPVWINVLEAPEAGEFASGRGLPGIR